MPITNPLREFVITGIKSLMFYDANGDMVADIDKLTDINISDETASSELRGGLNNPVILKIYGDRTCQLTASNSTISMDMLRIMTGNTVAMKTIAMPYVKKAMAISGNKVTLATEIASGENVTVYLSNDKGENLTKLRRVSSGTPAAGEFTVGVNNKDITFATGTTGFANVYAFTNEESEAIEARGGAFPVYKAKGVCLLTSTTNGRLYKGVIDMPACQISPSVSLAGKNSSDAPDANSLTLDLLDSNGYPYAIQAKEISDKGQL
ncbi:MAG: hypothetical protein ACRDD7_03480 [Peptostreptococcaceae bacterium]